MAEVKIKYNNNLVPPLGSGPTPYLSTNSEMISYGDRWGLVDKITLNGQITGFGFSSLVDKQAALVNVFGVDYKDLIVTELGSAPVVFTGCSVESVTFDNNNYNGIVPYSISLSCYNGAGFLAKNFGILDPKDEIRISAGNDGFGTVSRSIEAKGFVVGGDINAAISNVKSFVASKTGVSKIKSLTQLAGSHNATAFSPVLTNISENLNRLDLTYSVELGYKFKLASSASENSSYSFNNDFITSYSTNLSSGAGDDFVTASIDGEIQAPRSGSLNFDNLFAKLSELNPYNIITGTYGTPNGLAFCKDPVQFAITENSGQRKISFNGSYDNSEFYAGSAPEFFSGCYLESSISHSVDELTKTSTIELKGDIKCRGIVSNRYANSLAYLNNLTTNNSYNLYQIVNQYYTGWLNDKNPILKLNQAPLSLDTNLNPQLGTISISAGFDNKDRLHLSGISDFSIGYAPYNTVYASSSSCNDSILHLVVDMNAQKREKTNLDINLSLTNQSESSILNVKNEIFEDFISSFVNPLVEDGLQKETSTSSINNSVGINSDKIGSTVNASESYSFELAAKELKNRGIFKS